MMKERLDQLIAAQVADEKAKQAIVDALAKGQADVDQINRNLLVRSGRIDELTRILKAEEEDTDG